MPTRIRLYLKFFFFIFPVIYWFIGVGCQPVDLKNITLPKDFGDDTKFSLSLSTISSEATSVKAGETTTVTVTVRDTQGNLYTKSSLSVSCTISGGGSDGTFSSPTDNQDGTYELVFTATTAGSESTVQCLLNGEQITSSGVSITVTFTPVAISGIAMWLDASQLNLSNNDSVSSWTDLSGKSNHATQTTASSQPQFQTNQINSNPAISFDGVDDFLTFTNSISMQPATVFIVGKYTSTGTRPYIGNNTYNEFLGYTVSSVYYYSSQDNISVAQTPPSSFQIYSVNAYMSGTNSHLDINGATVVSGDLSMSSSSMYYIARRNTERFHGLIAEVIIYNTNLSSSDYSSVLNYLSNKYGITLQ